MSSKGKFRSKGKDILKPQSTTPNSIHTFLANDQSIADNSHKLPSPHAQSHKASSAQQPNCTNTQLNTKTNVSGANGSHPTTLATEDLVRLHVQIRQDLADRLLERVFQLKRRPGRQKKAASQRAIIEAALESYFEEPQNDRDTQP